mgnify:CR=1 FL=1
MNNQPVPLNVQDIQGNILTSYGVGFARYLFYRIDLPDPARSGLAALISNITTEGRTETGTPPSMLNVAFTYQGLKALGISPTSLNSFPPEFQQGMRRRASALCDFGESAPEHWTNALGLPQLHLLVLAHGATADHCTAMADWVRNQVRETGGLTLILEMKGDGLPENKEHFGFRDGISQPWIRGTHPGPPIEPHGGKRTPQGPQPLNPGEFILGHLDELNRIPQGLKPDLLGHNGTYLVFRKLYQNVARFNAEMEEQAAYVFGDRAAKDRLTALTVGRWPSGCPVDLSQETDDLGIAADPARINAFSYEQDGRGDRCPVGAHIRRTNPRDLATDKNGNLVVEPMATRHRMIRRSLPYGPPLNGTEDDGTDRGLLFIALVADIARQFEFVQRNWVNNGDPFRLDRTDRDPLIGNNRDPRDSPPPTPPGLPHQETPRKLTVPGAARIPWALNLPEFVKTDGGDYFFLPSVTALKGLATLGFSSFLKEYAYLDSLIQDPRQRAYEQTKLIQAWLIYRPKEILDELLTQAQGEQGTIFQTPGYLVFGSLQYSVPPIAIITKYDDVLEALDTNRHPELSVELYRQKMEIPPPGAPRGPFILGKSTSDPLYKQEMPLLADAVRTHAQHLPRILQNILDPIFAGLKTKGRLDVVQDLAWPVPLGLTDRYFGVPGPDPVTIKRWMRDIYKELFLNLRRDQEWTRLADIAAAEMNHYLDGLIQQYDRASNTVLNELIDVMTAPPAGLAPNFVRRNIMGLTVGVVETNLKAIARTIDQLIRRPDQLAAAQAAARRHDGAAVLTYAREAMRFNPQNHVLFRSCEKDTPFAAGTGRKTVIKRGTLVFAATLSAMHDPTGPFTQPETFNPGRDPSLYLFFGHDGHECLGRHLVPMILQEVFLRLLTLENLRRAHDDPFDPVDLLPEHFYLEFDPGR